MASAVLWTWCGFRHDVLNLSRVVWNLVATCAGTRALCGTLQTGQTIFLAGSWCGIVRFEVAPWTRGSFVEIMADPLL